MSTTVAQVFVITDRLDRLLKAAESYLIRWTKAVRADWPETPFLNREASRNTFVLPPLGGWSCLMDPDSYNLDYSLAEYLSKALETRAVAVQVRGEELAWSVATYVDGELEFEDREPPEAFGVERPAGDGPMPIYPDPVREALRVLSAEGVPAEYRLLRREEFDENAQPDEPGAFWVDELVARPEKRDVNLMIRAPYRLRRNPDRPSVPPDVNTIDDDRRRVFVEIRRLWGRPDHQALDNLLEIERADTNRLLEPFIDKPDSLTPNVMFDYTGVGAADSELKSALERRRPIFFGARPDMRSFARLALDAARSGRPEWENVRADGFGLRFESSGRPESIDLTLPYDDFMEGRLVARTPQEAIEQFLSRAFGDLSGALSADDFEATKSRLYPCLVASGEAERLADKRVVSRKLGHSVSMVVGCRLDHGSALIDTEDLARWRIDFDDAAEAACDNVDRSLANSGGAFMKVEISPGASAVASLAGGQPASILAARGLLKALSGFVGSDDILCAVPDQDSFFAVPHGDPALAKALRDYARLRMSAAEYPLTAELFRVNADGLSEA